MGSAVAVVSWTSLLTGMGHAGAGVVAAAAVAVVAAVAAGYTRQLRSRNLPML